ncbi:MAG TPA: serine protease [Candidatus Hydrogenedentes bacterium]|nr:serine protease [Candidatus Hydrogenedentota bacterium]
MSHRSFRALGVALVVWSAAFTTEQACAETPIEQARHVFETRKYTVVTVQLVIKRQYSFGGRGSQEREEKQEASGTVIDPSGLTVMSLTDVDPTLMYAKLAKTQGMSDYKMESNVTSVTILCDDGSEVEAQVLLRDPDLDLAFIRPSKKPVQPFEHVDLTDAAHPQMLDELLFVNRLGKVARRTYSATLDRVEGIVTKPRTLYIPGQQNQESNAVLGSPAFTLDGRFVGIAAVRADLTESTSLDKGLLAVVMPAEHIAEVAAQVPPLESEGATDGGSS